LFRAGPIPLQPFRKDQLQVGISAQDQREGSELAYPGPEVVTLSELERPSLGVAPCLVHAVALPCQDANGALWLGCVGAVEE
jgi:hypothetical protein